MQLFFATVARNTLNERLAGLGQWNVVVVVVAAVVVRRLLISITSHRQRRPTSCQFNAVPISTLAIFLAVHSFLFFIFFFKKANWREATGCGLNIQISRTEWTVPGGDDLTVKFTAMDSSGRLDSRNGLDRNCWRSKCGKFAQIGYFWTFFNKSGNNRRLFKRWTRRLLSGRPSDGSFSR